MASEIIYRYTAYGIEHGNSLVQQLVTIENKLIDMYACQKV
jgi:hypothetical protein